MTKEKILKTFEDINYVYNNCSMYYTLKYMLDELTEPCEDCISRQAVLDAFNLSEKTRKYGGDHSGYDTMMLYEIQDVIEALPSVQPIRPKGEWKKTPRAVMGEGYMWYCNKCEFEVYQDSSRPYPSEKFCPHCGADMRGNNECD